MIRDYDTFFTYEDYAYFNPIWPGGGGSKSTPLSIYENIYPQKKESLYSFYDFSKKYVRK